MAVFDDLQEVASLAGIETIRAPIIKDEQIGLGKRSVKA